MNRKTQGWLIISYTVPAKPVNNRIKLWRRLAQAGAVPLKGAVYILPYSEEHQEFFQWLITEVQSLGGGGFFAKVDRIENMRDEDIIALFDGHLEREYRSIEKALSHFETKLAATRKGGKELEATVMRNQLRRHEHEYELLKKRDFFSSPLGKQIGKRISALATETARLAGAGTAKTHLAPSVPVRNADAYRHKTWVTRRKPFVDRMASAWLIRRFVDDKAQFDFADDSREGPGKGDKVTFDMRDADFTHTGDLCTFEVLLKSFGLKHHGLARIAEIVHELDIRDDKYRTPEAKGIEEILTGISKTAGSDHDALEKGMAIFEMLYASVR